MRSQQELVQALRQEGVVKSPEGAMHWIEQSWMCADGCTLEPPPPAPRSLQWISPAAPFDQHPHLGPWLRSGAGSAGS